jgi:hypothetical protein
MIADKDGFDNIDFSSHADDLLPDEPDNVIIAPNDNLEPEVITNTTPLIIEAEPEVPATPVQTVVEPEPDQPEVIMNPDGTFVEISKAKGQWKAVLDSTAVGGRSEVFYGKTKSELFTRVAVGKMNATKEITKLNRKIKLGDETSPTSPIVQKLDSPSARPLTADEKIEIKTLMETDPDKALEIWYQKRSGQTIEENADNSQQGRQANINLKMEEAAKAFVARNPAYYPDQNYQNYWSLVSYLTKNKLGKVLTAANEIELVNQLVVSGNYTAESLEEAFNELSEDGLLLVAPRTPAQPVAQTPPAAPPEPPAQNDRIVRTETRPRAGLGIRSSDVTPSRAPEPTPLSAESLENLSDAEIERLYQATVRLQQTQGQRR